MSLPMQKQYKETSPPKTSDPDPAKVCFCVNQGPSRPILLRFSLFCFGFENLVVQELGQGAPGIQESLACSTI